MWAFLDELLSISDELWPQYAYGLRRTFSRETNKTMRIKIAFIYFYHIDVRHSLIIICMVLVATLMAHIIWYLWIYTGSANANFYFTMTMVFNVAQVKEWIEKWIKLFLEIPRLWFAVCLFKTEISSYKWSYYSTILVLKVNWNLVKFYKNILIENKLRCYHMRSPLYIHLLILCIQKKTFCLIYVLYEINDLTKLCIWLCF
jgi:hypothetical protein